MENTRKQKKKDLPFWPFVLLAKSAKLLKVAKAIKLLKFSKILITFFSMTLSVFVYAFMRGPWFSMGFVLMLFIHEMGHVIAMRHKGYPASAPVFIPLLGAVIFAPAFKNAEEEAYIGYGGPLLGGLAALALFGLWAILPAQHPLLLMISYSAAFLNLFNLIPIRPLDGGRVTRIVGRWFKWIGVAGLILLLVVIKDPVMFLISTRWKFFSLTDTLTSALITQVLMSKIPRYVRTCTSFSMNSSASFGSRMSGAVTISQSGIPERL